jgi:hypothetical protein
VECRFEESLVGTFGLCEGVGGSVVIPVNSGVEYLFEESRFGTFGLCEGGGVWISVVVGIGGEYLFLGPVIEVVVADEVAIR